MSDGGDMTEEETKNIERLVGALRHTHDELGRQIGSDDTAARRLLEKARDQLFQVVSAYDGLLKKK